MPPRVVLDTVVFVQALISNRGPSAACVQSALTGQFVLLLSKPVIDEMRGVPLRPELTRRYSHLTSSRAQGFVDAVLRIALILPTPPQAFALPRDPKDEPLIDLAVAGGAQYLVTWNERHLTYLCVRTSSLSNQQFPRSPCPRVPASAFTSRAAEVRPVLLATEIDDIIVNMTAIRAVFDGKVFVPQRPVSLPAQSEALVLVDAADPHAQQALDQAVQEYYRGGADAEDEAWGSATAPQSHRAWDED